MTTETKSRRSSSKSEPETTTIAGENVGKGMTIVLTTGRAELVDEVEGRSIVRSWDAGDELVVGKDVDVDEAIRMLNADLAEAKADPPARSAGERR